MGGLGASTRFDQGRERIGPGRRLRTSGRPARRPRWPVTRRRVRVASRGLRRPADGGSPARWGACRRGRLHGAGRAGSDGFGRPAPARGRGHRSPVARRIGSRCRTGAGPRPAGPHRRPDRSPPPGQGAQGLAHRGDQGARGGHPAAIEGALWHRPRAPRAPRRGMGCRRPDRRSVRTELHLESRRGSHRAGLGSHPVRVGRAGCPPPRHCVPAPRERGAMDAADGSRPTGRPARSALVHRTGARTRRSRGRVSIGRPSAGRRCTRRRRRRPRPGPTGPGWRRRSGPGRTRCDRSVRHHRAHRGAPRRRSGHPDRPRRWPRRRGHRGSARTGARRSRARRTCRGGSASAGRRSARRRPTGRTRRAGGSCRSRPRRGRGRRGVGRGRSRRGPSAGRRAGLAGR